MSRFVKLAVLVVLALPSVAAGQARSLQARAAGSPSGMAVPTEGAAAAEEPTALEVNPAGTGFVDGLTLQYFHEGGDREGQGADGAWVGARLGPIVPTFAMQWIRPGDGAGARFRKTSLGLALGDGRAVSLAGTANWYSSRDGDLDRLTTFDVGVTVRPWRHLSVGAAMLGLNAFSGTRSFPVQLDLGLATRLWRDRLTLSFDLLGDDAGRNDYAFRSAAVGVGAEIFRGLAVHGQVLFPIRDAVGPAGSVYGQVSLSWNGPFFGLTVGRGAGDATGDPWLVGARLSTRRYLGAQVPSAPIVDLARTLAREQLSWLGPDRNAYVSLLERLEAYGTDPSVRAVVVDVDELPLGQGRVEELRAVLAGVRARKPVVAYLKGGGWKEYYLATAATQVLMPPSAYLNATGLSTTSFFVKDTLDRLGVAVDVVAIGEYKNAPDALARKDMSPAQREVTSSILDDVFSRQVAEIARARGLPEDRVRSLVDVGTFTAGQAVTERLIDAVAWPDELAEAVARNVGRKVPTARATEVAPLRAAQRWGRRPAIAVVRVEGAIVPGESRSMPFGAQLMAGAETISELLDQAVRDHDVVAIVLRIESPGGDGLASDLVWRKVMQARRAGKPVVVSMGDLAASGGYLVATAADVIVAESSTLTGSIGVFAIKPDVSGLLDKIGVQSVTVKRGAHADALRITRRWTDEERARLEKQLRAFYDLFLERVASGRKLEVAQVEPLARGRVWTGAQARERGLVDQVGTFEDAVRKAVELSHRDRGDIELRPFEAERGLLRRVARSLAGTDDSPVSTLLSRAPALGMAAALMEMGPLVAVPPEWVGLAALDGTSPP